jgi:hypothetical protein
VAFVIVTATCDRSDEDAGAWASAGKTAAVSAAMSANAAVDRFAHEDIVFAFQ